MKRRDFLRNVLGLAATLSGAAILVMPLKREAAAALLSPAPVTVVEPLPARLLVNPNVEGLLERGIRQVFFDEYPRPALADCERLWNRRP